MPKPENNKKLTLSAKLKQLETDVEWFYGDDFTIDEAVQKYQAAAQLAADINHDLAQLKNEVEVLADFGKNH